MGCSHTGVYSKGYYSGESGQSNNTEHVVKAGETLYSIAFQYRQDYRQLARWNNIDNHYTIYPQQRLRVKRPTRIRTRYTKKDTNVNNSKHPANHSTVYKPEVKTRPGSQVLSWEWPTKGPILSRFSASDPGQKGIDIGGRRGVPIYAAEAGYVVYSGSGLRGYGKLIIIKHNETFLSAYAHNNRLRVKEGEKVKKGERIADMGDTGTDKVKLHFEIRRNGTPENPFKFLPK
ncbi:MAG: peptidoglycan DD-metalloendopeptidase family protein [Gammaproteobacteria bacterium]|nr:peptidoglycan DD-metalloendopeptidase family protein [Gammaproteobacteria bacterium]